MKGRGRPNLEFWVPQVGIVWEVKPLISFKSKPTKTNYKQKPRVSNAHASRQKPDLAWKRKANSTRGVMIQCVGGFLGVWRDIYIYIPGSCNQPV